jgi:hypothetical protein
MFKRFGNPSWWFGKNSIIGKHGGTISLPGGFSYTGAGLSNTTQQPGQMGKMGESDMLKYGGLALLVYLVVAK